MGFAVAVFGFAAFLLGFFAFVIDQLQNTVGDHLHRDAQTLLILDDITSGDVCALVIKQGTQGVFRNVEGLRYGNIRSAEVVAGEGYARSLANSIHPLLDLREVASLAATRKYERACARLGLALDQKVVNEGGHRQTERLSILGVFYREQLARKINLRPFQR